MQIHQAISAIEKVELPENMEKARQTLEQNLRKISHQDFETRGTYYYYLLRITLESHVLFETEVERHFYEKMIEYFDKQEKKYEQQFQKDTENEVLRSQANAFYRLTERYFSTLITLYAKKGFSVARQRAYLQKMIYRQNSYRLFRQRGLYALYQLWRLTALYGVSFTRWGASCFVAILFYGMIYLLSGGLDNSAGMQFHWYDAFHFSIATFTTLGFGDIIPTTVIAKIIADTEVFNGYLMLGAFMALVQRRIF